MGLPIDLGIHLGIDELGLGPELVLNGSNLVNTNNWAAGNAAILSAVNGRLHIVNNGAVFGPNANQQPATIAGRRYCFSTSYFPILRSWQIWLGSGGGQNDLARIIDKDAGLTVIAPGANGIYITFIHNGAQADAAAEFGNISLKEILP